MIERSEVYTPPYELARADDLDTSKAAAQRVDAVGWSVAVYESILVRGIDGATQRDLEGIYGEGTNKTISPRFAPLRRKGLIFDSGQRRDGCAVWVATEWQDLWLEVATPAELLEMEKSRARGVKKITCPCCNTPLELEPGGEVRALLELQG